MTVADPPAAGVEQSAAVCELHIERRKTGYLPATRFLASAASVSMADTLRYAAGSCPSRSARRKTVILISEVDGALKLSR